MRQPTRDTVLAGLFAALTAVGAFLRVPLPPVPFTLQPLIVLLAGVALRPALAAGSQLAYLAVGLLGLPVFAQGGGPAYVLQPTFGFLVGFPAAAWVTSLVARGGGNCGAARTALGLLCGLAALYAFGVLGLYLNLSLFLGKPEAFRKAIWGMGWFLAFDAVKVALAAAVAPAVRRALHA